MSATNVQTNSRRRKAAWGLLILASALSLSVGGWWYIQGNPGSRGLCEEAPWSERSGCQSLEFPAPSEILRPESVLPEAARTKVAGPFWTLREIPGGIEIVRDASTSENCERGRLRAARAGDSVWVVTDLGPPEPGTCFGVPMGRWERQAIPLPPGDYAVLWLHRGQRVAARYLPVRP